MHSCLVSSVCLSSHQDLVDWRNRNVKKWKLPLCTEVTDAYPELTTLKWFFLTRPHYQKYGMLSNEIEQGCVLVESSIGRSELKASLDSQEWSWDTGGLLDRCTCSQLRSNLRWQIRINNLRGSGLNGKSRDMGQMWVLYNTKLGTVCYTRVSQSGFHNAISRVISSF